SAGAGASAPMNALPWRAFSWMHLVVSLKSTHLRIKRFGTVQLCDLANVSEIVEGEFVQQFADPERAQLLVRAFAIEGGRRQSLEPGKRLRALAFKRRQLLDAAKSLS